jgi:hypothetical protein
MQKNLFKIMRIGTISALASASSSSAFAAEATQNAQAPSGIEEIAGAAYSVEKYLQA